MSDHAHFNFPPTVPQPAQFFNSQTGAPFTQCSICGKHFHETPDEPYLVEKAIRRYPDYDTEDVIFEYAICMEVAEKMRKEMSEDSRRNVELFFSNRVNMEARNDELLLHSPDDAAPWLSQCIVTGQPRTEQTEYQLMGMCIGTELVLYNTPYILGADALEQIGSLLSKQTRDEMDGFFDRFNDTPPELRELLKKGKLVLV